MIYRNRRPSKQYICQANNSIQNADYARSRIVGDLIFIAVLMAVIALLLACSGCVRPQRIEQTFIIIPVPFSGPVTVHQTASIGSEVSPSASAEAHADGNTITASDNTLPITPNR